MVHNSVVQAPPPGYEYDGIVEWWFDSAEAARMAFGGSGGSADADANAEVNTSDVRSQLPAAYGALVDLQHSVFLFTQVTHQRP